ncbi:MAG: hypothetical protein COT17_03360 [Elusimicrobia bacterium CG08_land_8_20_14_0_20_51_18]|nr:MAG: hypothetical protein COT17_03360 [Elusimicrobia bacterium CG08_land_8_20_14_0_20_51_18]
MKKIIMISAAIAALCGFSYANSFEEDINSANGSQEVVVPQPRMENASEASEKDLAAFYEYFDNMMKTREVSGEADFDFDKSGEMTKASVLYNIDLEAIRNEYLKSPITFKTSKGTVVYVSGSKSSNCPDLSNSCKDKEKFFMVLTTSGGQTFFIRAMEIINWSIFMNGSKTVVIDGEKYVAKVHANASDPEKSKLEIKGPRGAVISSSLDKLGEALAAKGVDVKLSKAYKLAYGNEIMQTGKGNAKFTESKLLLLIPFPVVDSSSYFLIKADDIKPAGTAFPSMEPGYSFKLDEGKLQISKL